MLQQQGMSHSVQSSTLSDVLERVLDKGIVIAGDIRVKLVDIELLSIQIRLVICSVDKAKEMGMDWWVNNPIFRREMDQNAITSSLASIEERMGKLEASFSRSPVQVPQSSSVIPSPVL
ncbi:MAG: gas vesicle protein [Acidobacteriia bacterium]|nr:gas vesicle protein [Terriglobia bacterium]